MEKHLFMTVQRLQIPPVLCILGMLVILATWAFAMESLIRYSISTLHATELKKKNLLPIIPSTMILGPLYFFLYLQLTCKKSHNNYNDTPNFKKAIEWLLSIYLFNHHSP